MALRARSAFCSGVAFLNHSTTAGGRPLLSRLYFGSGLSVAGSSVRSGALASMSARARRRPAIFSQNLSASGLAFSASRAVVVALFAHDFEQ
jgi:hypothetical protein